MKRMTLMTLMISSLALCIISCTDSSSTNDGSTATIKELHRKVPFLTSVADDLLQQNAAVDPFVNSTIPDPKKYPYPLFSLNHAYPASLPAPVNLPWKKVTNNGLITQANSEKYVLALKEYVSDDMKKLIYDKKMPNNKNWFQSIWLGAEREPVHGMYVGSGFPADTLTDQTLNLTTYVYTLYDKTAAQTLGNIWGRDLYGAMNPAFNKTSSQYAEGSVIVKFSFVTSCGSDWSPMTNTAIWEIYAPVDPNNGSAHSKTSKCKNNGSTAASGKAPVITNLYMMQFDMIVKDSVAAPDTGWVFTTLVYDKDAGGKDAWDNMVPLGATWGGNPDVINTKPGAITPPVTVNPALSENWINLNTPLYTRSTLAWDGRLSGPNDGAVVTPAWAGGKYYHKGIASAGCLACHSSAQYPMTSFLLPTTTLPPKVKASPEDPDTKALVMLVPGSEAWMQYFQSNAGTKPLGPKTAEGELPIALDYDMVTAFKAVPMWQAAVKSLSK